MSKKTIISIIILVFLSVLSVWVFFTDSTGKIKLNTDTPSSSASKDDKDNEKVKVSDLIITETNEGKKIWEVIAVSGNYEKSMEKIVLKNVKGNFYKDSTVVLSIEAPVAIYDSVNKEVILKNGARALNNKNVLITANEICWAGSKDIITATGNVKITQDNKLMTKSNKSVFNTSFTYLKLSGNSDSYVYR